jgi:hypothetical protein
MEHRARKAPKRRPSRPTSRRTGAGRSGGARPPRWRQASSAQRRLPGGRPVHPPYPLPSAFRAWMAGRPICRFGILSVSARSSSPAHTGARVLAPIPHQRNCHSRHRACEDVRKRALQRRHATASLATLMDILLIDSPAFTRGGVVGSQTHRQFRHSSGRRPRSGRR